PQFRSNGGDPDVTGQGEFTAASEGEFVDRGDDRLVARRHRVSESPAHLRKTLHFEARQVRHLFDVRTGDERPVPRPREDDGADIRGHRQMLDRHRKFPQDRRVQRVQCVRAVDGDDGEAVFHLRLDEARHDCLLPPRNDRNEDERSPARTGKLIGPALTAGGKVDGCIGLPARWWLPSPCYWLRRSQSFPGPRGPTWTNPLGPPGTFGFTPSYPVQADWRSTGPPRHGPMRRWRRPSKSNPTRRSRCPPEPLRRPPSKRRIPRMQPTR